MTNTTYVATLAERPVASGTDLDAVLAHVVTEATRYSTPDRQIRWDPIGDRNWRLMSRTVGKGRWAWTQYAVHAVPTVAPAAGGGAR